MIAHCVDAYLQGLRDFLVAPVLRDQFQDFHFARRQFCMDEEMCVWGRRSNYFNLKLQASISSEQFLLA